VLAEKDGKYFVTYTGYSKTWDEWAEGHRVRVRAKSESEE